jgi:RHS repeat-associated protein
MASQATSPNQIITLPKGGGAQRGLGEKFSPDLHTGTGNFTVPIALPPGRNGFQPQLNLVYSTGNGNGLFGIGWNLSIPGVTRKTSHGIPRYQDYDRDVKNRDTFILSGAEDLVPVKTIIGEPGKRVVEYRPRTEGLFAKILHHYEPSKSNYWEVRSKDGLVSRYGTRPSAPSNDWIDPAVVYNPKQPRHVFAWKLTDTRDPFNNRIAYAYEADEGEAGPHRWRQPILRKIEYVDYTDDDPPKYLVSVTFQNDARPDPFSDYRAGFEIRTSKRCKSILIQTHADPAQPVPVRGYDFEYENDAFNGVSLLKRVNVIGYDDAGTAVQELPPLEFGYSGFVPNTQKFFAIQGRELPPRSLANPDLELVDVIGNGLPDVLEMNGTVRYWRNIGGGVFAWPREMREAPAGVGLADPGVQMIDANGDGRMDLLVTAHTLSGYYPLKFGGQWDHRSFQKYRMAPSFSLEDPEVRLVDLTGDGITDAVRSGSRLECYFNDPHDGWNDTRWVERRTLEAFPNVSFADPRVKWADMTGDGMQDIVLVHDGNIEYWPNLGYGSWGKRIHMVNSPRFPYGYDPKRILLGDVDGDGCADLVYVDHEKVTLWINRGGNGWSGPVVITGTPPVSDMDSIRLVDLLGSGISGVLWSADLGTLGQSHMYFLDFTGGVKPYLLTEMNNHMGAVTEVEYKPSTHFYLEDEKRLETRWKTFLPFPVHVVAKVEVIDDISKGKLTTEYRYHHGYWDGAEREFRGFGMVEQLDTENFQTYNEHGLHGKDVDFKKVDDRQQFSPPTLTKTWFHQGPVGEEFGDWSELDYSEEFWNGDRQVLDHTGRINTLLKGISERRVKRDALRTLRGSIFRTELYAQDGTPRQARPYTVTEQAYEWREESRPTAEEKGRPHIFFPHAVAQRTTQWERGDDPMTQFTFTEDYDDFGQARRQTNIACPRGWRKLEDVPGKSYLASRTQTDYASPATNGPYIVDRVARSTTYEIVNDGQQTLLELRDLRNDSSQLNVIGQVLNFYDRDPAQPQNGAFLGLSYGQVGEFGALARTVTLVMNEEILHEAYKIGESITNPPERPPYLTIGNAIAWTSYYPTEFQQRLPSKAGYTFHTGDATYARGYFAATERRRYDFHQTGGQARGMVVVQRDALGRQDTQIDYDAFHLLPTKVTNTVSSVPLITEATYNYRVLQPRLVTDPNGNQTQFFFTALGLLKDTWLMGDKQRPSVKMEYNFLDFRNSPPDKRRPIYVRTIRHIHHDTELDVPPSKRNETIETREYSDGFGRLVQTRTQGEEERFGDPVFGGAVLSTDQTTGAGGAIVGSLHNDTKNPNVVVSGWQMYDNKGRVVQKYEPFFSTGWEYAKPGQDLLDQAQRMTMFYDPRGQIIRTLNPDASEQRVIYGVPPDVTTPEVFAPTPWETYTYDANDNAGRTHPAGSGAHASHRNTPTSAEIDALGRTIRTIERNDAQDTTEWYETRSRYDIRGNVIEVIDPLGRSAFHYVYDLANRPLRINSIDAGTRRTVLDAAGNIVEQWDSKKALILRAYDALSRPMLVWARDKDNEEVMLRERLIYGESQSSAAADNLRGKLYRHYDEAGLLTLSKYDFKGNVLEKERQVIDEAEIMAQFPTAGPWPAAIQPFRVNWRDWDTSLRPRLRTPAYQTSTTYDALNRVKTVSYPTDASGQRKLLRPIYNRAGALEQVELDGTPYVRRIAYNTKGQRAFIAYRNSVLTRYAYDPKTFRLVRLRTEGYTASGLTYQPSGEVLQDYAYQYDLVGNIVALHDRTKRCGLPGNPDVLDRRFEYDPLYRLLYADGRECDTPPPLPPWIDTPKCHDVNSTRPYRQQYRYDSAGNLTQLRHAAGVGSFTRTFAHAGGSNRLSTMTIGVNTPSNTTPYAYRYDDNGNLQQENTERHFEWDHSDRMRVFRVQTGAAEPSQHAHYLYDAGGQRVMKLVRKQGGAYDSTVYIDGLFEHHHWKEGGTNKQNNRLHVMDNQSRIAIVRVGDKHPDDRGEAIQYHLEDHLGSSNVVINENGSWRNREEYFPYGETSFGSFAKKRYRYTGKERDEESGLGYYSARYYVPWTARWLSADPAGMVDSASLYTAWRNNPIRYVDPTGMGSSDAGSGYGTPLSESDKTPNAMHTVPSLHGFVDVPVPPMVNIKCDSCTLLDKELEIGGNPFDRITSEEFANADIGRQREIILGAFGSSLGEEMAGRFKPTYRAETRWGEFIIERNLNKSAVEYHQTMDAYCKLLGAFLTIHPGASMGLNTSGTLAQGVGSRRTLYGPSYSAQGAPSAGHHLLVMHFDEEFKLIQSFMEISGDMLPQYWRSKQFPLKMYLTHTEVKALYRLLPDLKKGHTLLFFGAKPVCKSGMCDALMHTHSLGLDIDILYYAINKDSEFILNKMYLGGQGRLSD